MKFSRELHSTGRLSLRKNEDKGKRERLILMDKSLHRAYVCLHCEKKKCCGEEKCFREAENKKG